MGLGILTLLGALLSSSEFEKVKAVGWLILIVVIVVAFT